MGRFLKNDTARLFQSRLAGWDPFRFHRGSTLYRSAREKGGNCILRGRRRLPREKCNSQKSRLPGSEEGGPVYTVKDPRIQDGSSG